MCLPFCSAYLSQYFYVGFEKASHKIKKALKPPDSISFDILVNYRNRDIAISTLFTFDVNSNWSLSSFL